MYACRYGSWKRSVTFDVVQPPFGFSNAPISTEPAGTNKNAIVYPKNGSVGSHASGRRLRPDARSGRRASDAEVVAMG
jgi:hypothetical protein